MPAKVFLLQCLLCMSRGQHDAQIANAHEQLGKTRMPIATYFTYETQAIITCTLKYYELWKFK